MSPPPQVLNRISVVVVVRRRFHTPVNTNPMAYDPRTEFSADPWPACAILRKYAPVPSSLGDSGGPLTASFVRRSRSHPRLAPSGGFCNQGQELRPPFPCRFLERLHTQVTVCRGSWWKAEAGAVVFSKIGSAELYSRGFPSRSGTTTTRTLCSTVTLSTLLLCFVPSN